MPQTSTPRTRTGDAQSERTRNREWHHSAGGANHWVRTVGALAPLVIGELVKDPEQKWRFIRITSVLLAVASEASYAHRLHKERQERDAQDARDDAMTR